MSQLKRTRQLPVAMQTGKSKFDFNKQVVATHDFGVMTPIECKLVFPGDKFDVKVDHFTRLLPMPSPTFGRIKEKLRAFFVPCRIIFKDWEDFISNNPNYSRTSGVTSSAEVKVPQINLSDLWLKFRSSTAHCTNVQSDKPYDFFVHEISIVDDEVSDDIKYYQLKPYGRHVMKLLNSIGYEMPMIQWHEYIGTVDDKPDLGDSSAELDQYMTEYVSLLPLLAWWRFYLDWIVPSRFIKPNHSILLSVLNNVFKGTNLTDGVIDSHDILPLLYLPYSFSNNDYFGCAFLSPYGYEDTKATDTIIPNNAFGIGYEESSDSTTIYNTFGAVAPRGVNVAEQGNYAQPAISYGGTLTDGQVYSNDETAISMLTIRSLGALQDMVNRGKLAGSKIQDYLKVTYGIEPSMSALDISTYLGSHDNDIMIGDVMSNSDTYDSNTGNGAVLGQYAGRALGGANNDSFEFSADEHGFFFISYELEVKSSYVQGLRPEVTALDRLQFFQPEIDNKFVDAIHMRELFTGSLFNDEDPTTLLSQLVNHQPHNVFGHKPVYSEYKTNFDTVIGDFRRHSVNAGYDSWFFARRLSPAQWGYNDWQVGISERFLRQFSETTSDNYDKVFMVADNSIDHFMITFNLNFDVYRHMIPNDEPLEFEDKKGKQIDVTYNGSVE